MLNYFAYGSNLHPVRLRERVSSAQIIGIAQLDKHILKFNKKSRDGSAKCNLVNTGKKSDFIHGAIYQLSAEHKVVLDNFEGKGFGYLDKQIELKFDNKKYNCFSYFAQQQYIVDDLQPYHWYKQLVALGASYLKFPASYTSSISAVDSCNDPEQNRRLQHELLLQKIKTFTD